MIATETTYNEALTLMDTALSQPEIIGSSDFLQALKVQVSILKLISDKLLENGKTGIALEISDEQHTPLRKQRTQLLNSFFHTYQAYAELFNRYVGEVKSNPDQFNNIDAYLRENSPNKLNFESHVIMPVQRGPRYASLVDAALDLHHKQTKRPLPEEKLLLLPENLAELRELESRFKALLQSINSKAKTLSQEDKYWFGKYTYEFIYGKSTSPVAASSSTTPAAARPYKFGDLTRGMLGRLFSAPIDPASVSISAPGSSQDDAFMADSSSDDESPASRL